MYSPHVSVPEDLVCPSAIPARATICWCFLRLTERTSTVLTFKEIREALGMAHNTLLRHFDLLAAAGWLRCKKWSNQFSYKTIWKRGLPAFRLPMDLICDRAVPAEAKLVAGRISKLTEPFGYEELERVTGYTQETLSKHLHILLRLGWLRGTVFLVERRKYYQVALHNPHLERRKRDVDLFRRSLAWAKKRIGYSLGQLLLSYMVSMLIADSILIENGHVWGMVNDTTGGRLLYDLLLPEYDVAMEFQGPQHESPTAYYPDEAEFRAQQARDALKRALSARLGIRLIEVKKEDLSFERLAALLRSAGVPLKADPRAAAAHLYDLLEREAAFYRATAA